MSKESVYVDKVDLINDEIINKKPYTILAEFFKLTNENASGMKNNSWYTYDGKLIASKSMFKPFNSVNVANKLLQQAIEIGYEVKTVKRTGKYICMIKTQGELYVGKSEVSAIDACSKCFKDIVCKVSNLQ